MCICCDIYAAWKITWQICWLVWISGESGPLLGYKGTQFVLVWKWGGLDLKLCAWWYFVHMYHFTNPFFYYKKVWKVCKKSWNSRHQSRIVCKCCYGRTVLPWTWDVWHSILVCRSHVNLSFSTKVWKQNHEGKITKKLLYEFIWGHVIKITTLHNHQRATTMESGPYPMNLFIEINKPDAFSSNPAECNVACTMKLQSANKIWYLHDFVYNVYYTRSLWVG